MANYYCGLSDLLYLLRSILRLFKLKFGKKNNLESNTNKADTTSQISDTQSIEMAKHEINSNFYSDFVFIEANGVEFLPPQESNASSNASAALSCLSSLNNSSNNLNNNSLNEMKLTSESCSNNFELDCFIITNSSMIIDNIHLYEDQLNDSNKTKLSNETNARGNNSGLPDLINSKESDKARKYLEGLDGVKFNEIQVPDNLKKQLEYFDRDELLQLIAYQKKYLDFKESRIKDLENYIDNLVVKIIETEPLILMNASNVLTKSRNLI